MGEIHGSPTYPVVQRVTAPDSAVPEQHAGCGVGQGAQVENCILKKWHLPLLSTQQNILSFLGSKLPGAVDQT